MTEARPASGGSNYIFLIVALAIGAVATAVAFVFLNAQVNKEQTEGPKVRILVAQRRLPTGAVIEARDLTEKILPNTPEARNFAKLCFTPDAPPEGRQRVNRPVLEGSPLMKVDVGGVADFETKWPYFAISIPVRNFEGVSGLLVPGDNVVLMITKPGIAATTAPIGVPGVRSATGFISHALFHGTPVRVAAAGTKLARSRTAFLEGAQVEVGKEAENMKTVTVEMTMEQAIEYLQETGGSNTTPVTLMYAPRKDEPAPAPPAK